PLTTAVTLNFSGNAHTPTLPLNVPANGYCIVSRQVPQVGDFDSIVGLPPQNGDVVYVLDPISQTYIPYMFVGGAGWIDPVGNLNPPTAKVGESFWICRGSSGSVPTPPKCQPDTTPPTVDCRCLRDQAHESLTVTNCQAIVPDLCKFTNCFS